MERAGRNLPKELLTGGISQISSMFLKCVFWGAPISQNDVLP
jgi:hypothetical protein